MEKTDTHLESFEVCFISVLLDRNNISQVFKGLLVIFSNYSDSARRLTDTSVKDSFQPLGKPADSRY